MYDKIWEGIGGKISDQWSAARLTSATLFWLGGLLAIADHFGWATLRQRFDALKDAEKVAVVAGVLFLLAASATTIQSCALPALRLLEGYWWKRLDKIRKWLVTRQKRQRDKNDERWQAIVKKLHLTLEEALLTEFSNLEALQRQFPVNDTWLMPTRLGNILRAAELRPSMRYGLDAVICWPRLWLILPDSVTSTLSEARQALDSAIRFMLWSMLFLGWGILAWWALPIGALGLYVGYRRALSAALTYAILIESTFDMFRFDLYDALRLPKPSSSAEVGDGERLTRFLLRGAIGPAIPYEGQPSRQRPSDSAPPTLN